MSPAVASVIDLSNSDAVTVSNRSLTGKIAILPSIRVSIKNILGTYRQIVQASDNLLGFILYRKHCKRKLFFGKPECKSLVVDIAVFG